MTSCAATKLPSAINIAKHGYRKRLIFNADDLGICSCINRGIERAHVNGVLTSASLAVTGRFAEEAVDICRRHPSLGVGIHLTLTELSPLSSAACVPSLLSKERHFHENILQLILSTAKGRIDFRQVRLEAEAQIRWAIARDIRISHLDSHQHWHIWPPMFEVVCDLAEKYGIRSVRVPKERFLLAFIKAYPRFRRLLQLVAIRGVCAMLPIESKSRVQAADFTGFYFGGHLSKSRLISIISTIKAGSCTEVICHPAQSTDSCQMGHYQGYDSVGELRALTDPDVIAFINANKIELSTYHAL